MTKKNFSIIILCVIFICAIFGLIPRVRLESVNNNVAIIADYREISALAKNSGIKILEAIEILKQNGITGIMVSELTGDNIEHGLGWAEFKIVRDPERSTEGTIVSILPGSPHKELLNEWLKIRFSIENNNNSPIFLPIPINMLKTVGIIPDIDGLEAAKESGLKIYYRPAPSPGNLPNNAAEMLKRVHEKYNIAVFTPSGEVVSGYPDVSSLAKVAKEFSIPLAVVEFSRQIGEKNLNALVSPMLIPLHSVTNEEMNARNISRQALRERLIRAAVERSVRLLLLRTAPQNTNNFKFEDFSQEVNLLAQELRAHNFNLAFPETLFKANPPHPFRTNTGKFIASFAASAMLMFSIWCYVTRMKNTNFTNFKINIIFVIVTLILTFLSVKVSVISRSVGALLAPMIAVEASLLSMDFNKNKSLLKGFLFVLIGGLSLASFFSVPEYMLRLQTFSGVKATLIIPPLLVILHDFKKRIHPESIIDFMSRPPLWGELVLCVVLLGAVVIMVFRSGNVAMISGFEEKIRVSLEKLLIARPRTREVFIGYPSILLLNFLVSKNYLAKYREILRIGVAIGFSSVINSFCHFHTPLTLTLLREFNGLWTGLLVGIILVLIVKFIIIPALKILRPLLS